MNTAMKTEKPRKCQDDEEWCSEVIESNCDVIAKEDVGVQVKHYCKKTCNLCDEVFVYQYPNPESYLAN